MQLMMERYEKEAEDFYGCFPQRVIPTRMQYLASFETWQMAMDAAQEAAVASSGGAIEPVRRSRLKQSLTRLNAVEAENKQLQVQIAGLEEKGRAATQEEKQLKEQLGQKYSDYHPMVQRLKEKLARLAQMCNDSVELPIELAHPYTYSNWDMVHEPDNVADNVLTDTSTQWKTLSPNIDLALAGGSAACFVAQVDICAGDCGPSTLIVHTSRNGDEWVKVRVLLKHFVDVHVYFLFRVGDFPLIPYRVAFILAQRVQVQCWTRRVAVFSAARRTYL